MFILFFSFFFFFFFNDTATTEIYTLSLHDALPISDRGHGIEARRLDRRMQRREHGDEDRKSTRLNSSDSQISYAVFCLKKKKKKKQYTNTEKQQNKNQKRNNIYINNTIRRH